MNRIIVCTLLAILVCSTTFAVRRARKGELPPKALLVILKTRQRQVDWMLDHHPEKVPRLKKDIQSVLEATVNDFNDHFSYCPVYYFADTLMDEVMAGRLSHVLLDKDLRPAKNVVLQDGDTSFFVVDFGQMSQSSKQERPEQGYVSLRAVLLVMDHRFEMLEWPRPGYARGFIGTGSSRYRDYWYRSKNHEIDYTPQAAAYHLTLQRYYQGSK